MRLGVAIKSIYSWYVHHYLKIHSALDTVKQDAGIAKKQLQRKSAFFGGKGHTPFFGNAMVQTKLAINQPNDPYEQEADAVADKVVQRKRMSPKFFSPAVVQRTCAGCEEEQLQRKEQEEELTGNLPVMLKASGAATDNGVSGLESTLNNTKGTGNNLHPNVRREMETGIGADFEQVKIHTDGKAVQMSESLNAKAFTYGNDIYFNQGQYNPEADSGKHLLAHELTHVVQQNNGLNRKMVQRGGGKDDPPRFITYSIFVPAGTQTLREMYDLFEIRVYGKVVGDDWECNDFCDMTKNRGKQIRFNVHARSVDKFTTPEEKQKREDDKEEYLGLPGDVKDKLAKEIDKKYYEASGNEPGSKIKKGEEGNARIWKQEMSKLLDKKHTLEELPVPVREIMGGEKNFNPADYDRLLLIAKKLEQFTPEDFAVYKLLAVRATDNLDLFEKSVDMYLARKEELRKAIENQQPKDAPEEESMEKAIKDSWNGFDDSGIGTMSQDDQYALARQKTSELTAAQLKYMREHPGETLKDFARSATLMNTPETFGGVWNDMKEAADGDAEGFARWAAGTGAGAKLSGWLLAAASILYVASWLTGVGELATIAAGVGILLGSTIVLSTAESELRIAAASRAKTPEEFKRNIEMAAAARANVFVSLAMIAVAAVLHFTAKAYFPKTVMNIKTSLKNFREKIRLKGSIYELKPSINTKMQGHITELTQMGETAKADAIRTAGEIETMTTEAFVEKLEKGDSGFFDKTTLPPDQQAPWSEMIKTPEGRTAIEQYKQQLANALKTDVPKGIDEFVQTYIKDIEGLLKEVDDALNHDELSAAIDRYEVLLGEENLKARVSAQQEQLIQEKIKQASEEVLAEAEKLKKIEEQKGKTPSATDPYKDATLGDKIGSGQYKEAYKLPDHPGKIIVVMKEGGTLEMLQQEIQILQDIEKTGIPVAKVEGLTSHNGRPAMVMKQYGGGWKPYGEGPGPRNLMTLKTIEDINAIRKIIVDSEVYINDLQFLVGEDGSLVVSDPLGVKTGSDFTSIRVMDDILIEATTNVAEKAMIPGKVYTKAQIMNDLLNGLVPEATVDDFLSVQTNERFGTPTLVKEGNGYRLNQ
jgi:Domain of unknown function (DUF4157)